MEQLAEIYNAMLQMESSPSPRLISPVALYDQSAPGGRTEQYADIRRIFERSLDRSTVFWRKLTGSSRIRGFDTPCCFEAENFDLDMTQPLWETCLFKRRPRPGKRQK